MEQHHGIRTRGLSTGLATVPQGPLFDSRSGRMFCGVPVHKVEQDDLRDLADCMTQIGLVDNAIRLTSSASPTATRPRSPRGCYELWLGNDSIWA